MKSLKKPLARFSKKLHLLKRSIEAVMINKIFIIKKLGLEMITLMSKALTKIFLVKLKQLQLQVVSHGGLEVFSLLVTPNHFFWNHNYES
jgi:hypothetical protein